MRAGVEGAGALAGAAPAHQKELAGGDPACAELLGCPGQGLGVVVELKGASAFAGFGLFDQARQHGGLFEPGLSARQVVGAEGQFTFGGDRHARFGLGLGV